ncbi:MAG: hypothetical protein IKG18_10935 [Atopobiaceae bacterium]|nr:hypothetical protein [Atopobiaceae bacterium]MBR3314642.1 hypothetical protein [Atopobiaceae bacterium]
MLELFGGLLAAGIAVALATSIVGLAMLGLLIWGGITIVNRITGKSHRQKNLPSGQPAPKRNLPQSTIHSTSERRAQAAASRQTTSSSQGESVTYAQVARDYEYLDVDNGATAETISKAMAAYEGAPYVGEYARGVISTLNKAEFRRKGLHAAIAREFEPNTITWDKFMIPIDVAMDGILRTCAQLANRVQGFDISEYERLKRLVRAGACEKGSSKWQRWQLFENTLAEMDELQRANEQLLFELEKLQDELTKLGGKSAGSSTDDIAEEIRKLAEDAKYYS